MQPNPLQQLAALGQSVWLDDIRRRWLVDGTLAALIEHDGLTGLTSNPAIFEPVPTELATLGLDIEALGNNSRLKGYASSPAPTSSCWLLSIGPSQKHEVRHECARATKASSRHRLQPVGGRRTPQGVACAI